MDHKNPNVTRHSLTTGALWIAAATIAFGQTSAPTTPEAKQAATAPRQAPAPADASKSIRLAEGIELRLFASEPLVRQPVSMSFDHRGRLWVLQYIQYPIPNGLKPTAIDQYLRTKYDRVPEPPPRGPKGDDRITILEDTDGDGRADHAKDFISNLNLASGMALGYDGVFVAQPPYLLFYPDRDHDDVPDGDPEVLLKGFGMEDAHAFANSLTWGPDGWLYGAQGSTVTADIRGIGFQQGIWRYHVPTKRFELFAEGGGNTWGIDFDRDGQLFAGGNTTEPLCHHVQGAYYIKGFGKHGPLHNPFAFGYFNPVKHVGFLGTALTGGCVIYQGGLLPERFNDVCIYPNLRANAMRSARLVPAGSTFESHYQEDFAVSSDVWFRPVDCLVGPDGALYAADWCDVNISHTSPKDRSQWYPPSRNDGRIWKFVPSGSEPRPKGPLNLERLSSDDLLKLLGHRNAWYSREARRILAERRDPSVAGKLKPLLFEDPHAGVNAPSGHVAQPPPTGVAVAIGDRQTAEGGCPTRQHEGPPVRVRHISHDHLALEALWAIYVSGGLDDELATTLLSHPSAAVRSWTIRLLGDECRVASTLAAKLVELAASEKEPTVRSQLACTAKRLPGEQALPIVKALLQRDEDAADRHIPLLLWWAIEDKSLTNRDEVLDLFTDHAAWQRPLVRGTVAERLARRYAADALPAGWQSCRKLLDLASDAQARDALIAAIDLQLAGSRLDTPPVELTEIIQGLLDDAQVSPAVLRLALRLQVASAVPKTLAIAVDRSAPTEVRVGLIEAIGATNHPECVERLLACLASQEPPAIQSAAMSALQPYGDGSIAAALIASYTRLSPELKARARALLVSRASWAKTLVGAVRAEKIALKDVEIEQVRQMRLHASPELQQEIESLWGRVSPATTRQKQGRISAVQTLLAKGKGDPAAGAQLLRKHCRVCHQLLGDGNKIGPDLTSVDRKNLALLLPNVIDPSAVIRPEFTAYSVETTDGRVLSGLLADSTAESVTLLDAKNVRTLLRREDIERLEPTGTSLMPEGILDALGDQEIRDLFAALEAGTIEASTAVGSANRNHSSGSVSRGEK